MRKFPPEVYQRALSHADRDTVFDSRGTGPSGHRAGDADVGWRDGRLAGIGEHDDTVMATWFVELAISRTRELLALGRNEIRDDGESRNRACPHRALGRRGHMVVAGSSARDAWVPSRREAHVADLVDHGDQVSVDRPEPVQEVDLVLRALAAKRSAISISLVL